MVDSDRGITNLHVPSDVIIDASMPAMIRTIGPDVERRRRPAGRQGRHPRLLLRGALRGDDRLLPRERRVRPDDDGHDAERRPDGAEGRGVRHRTTRRSRSPRRASCGSSRPRATSLLEHDVEAGDIWRACQTKDAPVRDWVRLAVERARATGSPAVFWLDETRAHDAEVLAKVRAVPRTTTTPSGLRDRDHAGRRGDALHARRARRAARTRSRSPATCCATT